MHNATTAALSPTIDTATTWRKCRLCVHLCDLLIYRALCLLPNCAAVFCAQEDRETASSWLRSHCISFTFVGDEFLPNPDFVFPAPVATEDGTAAGLLPGVFESSAPLYDVSTPQAVTVEDAAAVGGATGAAGDMSIDLPAWLITPNIGTSFEDSTLSELDLLKFLGIDDAGALSSSAAAGSGGPSMSLMDLEANLLQLPSARPPQRPPGL